MKPMTPKEYEALKQSFTECRNQNKQVRKPKTKPSVSFLSSVKSAIKWLFD